MNKHHPKTGLKRTQLYLTQESRDVLDLDCEFLARDERGRSVRNLTERVGQILHDYSALVRESMPEMSEREWMELFDRLRAVPGIAGNKNLSLAVCDAFYRFESFDSSMSDRDRLIAAGCKLT